jgi:ZIP family zinc transporter/zinc and cadmium transporter
VTLAIVLAVIAGLADLVGGLLTVARIKATRRSILYSTAIAAGFIVAAAMLDRIPDAIDPANPHGPAFILCGFLAIYLVENGFSTHAHLHGDEEHAHDPHAHEESHGHALVSQFQPEECLITPAAAVAALIGLLLHTLFDGIAIGAGFLKNTHTGLVMFLAVIFHKLPEGFSMSALMLAAGRPPRSAVTSAGMLGVSTVLGTLLALLVGSHDPAWAPAFLALETGSFLYIGCSDMLPATNKGQDRRALVLVLLGVGLFAASSWALEQAGFVHP